MLYFHLVTRDWCCHKHISLTFNIVVNSSNTKHSTLIATCVRSFKNSRLLFIALWFRPYCDPKRHCMSSLWISFFFKLSTCIFYAPLLLPHAINGYMKKSFSQFKFRTNTTCKKNVIQRTRILLKN